jgi:hypothetical protein
MDTNANQGLTTRERKALGQPISIGVVTEAQSEICVNHVHLRFGFLCVLCALLRLSRLVFFILAPLGVRVRLDFASECCGWTINPGPARVAASERMKLDHPIQDLWLKSGKIMQSRRDGLILPYMETPTVTIVERGQVSDPDADGLVRYPFKLNTSPHFVWCELFGKHRHVPVRIREKVLFLVCRPDVMKEKYALVKDAIISTNQDYEEEKRQLIPLLQNKNDTGANADDAVQQRREQIQKDFESLEL